MKKPKHLYETALSGKGAEAAKVVNIQNLDALKDSFDKIERRLPQNPRDSTRFLKAFESYAIKEWEQFDPEDHAWGDKRVMWPYTLEHIYLMNLVTLRSNVSLALRSSRPEAYLRFIMRPDFDFEDFKQAAPIFIDRWEITFEPLAREKMQKGIQLARLVNRGTDSDDEQIARHFIERLKKENKLVRFGRDEEAEDLVQCAGLLTSAIINDRSRGYSAVMRVLGYGNIRLDLEKEKPWELFHSLPDEIRELLLEIGLIRATEKLTTFEERFSKGQLNGFLLTDPSILPNIDGFTLYGTFHFDMFLFTESQRVVQHELQHLFDRTIALNDAGWRHERRAKLAEACFALGTSAKDNENEEIFDHFPRGMGRAGEEHLLAERSLKNSAGKERELLNSDYKKACGLTYDEILEPFNGK